MATVKVDISNAGAVTASVVQKVFKGIDEEVELRSWLVALEVRNAAMYVLRGQRTGRIYKVPGTYRRHRNKETGRMITGRRYRASAPGEPPANRTGVFRASWQMHGSTKKSVGSKILKAGIESRYKVPGGYLLGEILEDGRKDGKMAARPYKDRIKERAMKNAAQIYKRPYGGV